jgi:outer membrane receptor for Fe3+-dicitrate
VTRANFNSERDTPQTYWDFFVQDQWQMGRVTINPGLRYEQETMSGTIIKDWTLKNNWAPRIGATFDVAGDGKDQDLRQLRSVLRPRPERPCSARSLG